jgi:acetyl esterase/lipase
VGRTRIWALLALLPLVGAGAWVTSVTAEAGPARETVSICSGQLLDVYPAEHARRAVPAVLYVHGGAWVEGWRRNTGDLFPELLPRLHAAGLVVAATDYRLAAQKPWPAARDDVACAIGYLRSHAASLHLDPARVRLYGTSAGGQIAAVLGLTGTPGVDRVADLYGPADLRRPQAEPAIAGAIRAEFGPGVAGRAAASPALLARPGAPSFLIVQGRCDEVVPWAQSEELADRLAAAGDPVQLVLVSGAGHSLQPCGGAKMSPSLDSVLSRLTAFLAA